MRKTKCVFCACAIRFRTSSTSWYKENRTVRCSIHSSSITNSVAHTSAASSRLNWLPCRFEWTHPFRRKTKCGFCACAIRFCASSTSWYKENRTVRCSIRWRTKKKSKFVPVDIMEVYWESRGVVLLILNLSARGKWVVNFMPQAPYTFERILVPLFLPGFIPRIFQHVAWSLYPLCYPSPYEQSTSVFNLMGHFRSRIMNVLVMINNDNFAVNDATVL